MLPDKSTNRRQKCKPFQFAVTFIFIPCCGMQQQARDLREIIILKSRTGCHITWYWDGNMPQGSHCGTVCVLLEESLLCCTWDGLHLLYSSGMIYGHTHADKPKCVCTSYIVHWCIRSSRAQHRTSTSTWLVIVLINTAPTTAELNYPFKRIVLRDFQLKISMALSFCKVVCLMSLSCGSARDHCSFQCALQIHATWSDSLDFKVKVSVAV